MRAMVLNELNTPLQWTEMPDRLPGPNDIRVEVSASVFRGWRTRIGANGRCCRLPI